MMACQCGRTWLATLLLLAATQAGAEEAERAVFSWSQGNISLAGHVSALVSSVNTFAAGFGTGSYGTDGRRVQTNIAGLEGFAVPQVAAAYKGAGYDLYGRVSATIGVTTAEGDALFPYDLTRDGPHRADWEEAVAGIRSGTLPVPGTWDLSAGHQNFAIGDGFLIQTAGFTGGRRGAFYAGTRGAFRNTAVLRLDQGPVHLDVFRLGTNNSQRDAYFPFVGTFPNSTFYGLNAEYRGLKTSDGSTTQTWAVGGAFLHVSDADPNAGFAALNGGARADRAVVPASAAGATRRGMNVFDLRAAGQFFPNLPQLFVSGEFVYESNPSDGRTGEGFVRRLEANAWYAEAAWTFVDAPWKPRIGARYAHFSGQRPGATHATAYDPLAYGYSTAPWRLNNGTWFMGQIIGEYYLFNTNENVAMLYASAAPTEQITLWAYLYDFRFDQNPAPTVTSLDAFRELDLEADYVPSRFPWLTVTGLGAIAEAGRGGRQYINTIVSGLPGVQSPKAAGSYQGLALLNLAIAF